ncbi:acetoin utilization protein AcuC [Georgenia yuyongxinii]|uniref:Acetoin utilization protein AcuC n=1 Tax=Georgenia yuyongxinii TaxID=2589797 RepID=A0A552WP10_9MICO|nr:acetoin utilization protein AcuC [Georgenia yuyongxinii]TRW44437.1 acetoin utilization protein AcuC [Georgenia yuyongxinii]TRW44756.1 acetoin utilization protein AcuC [Georgenia yuyongxinii]
MLADALLVWSEDLVSYDFGLAHPMTPVRLLLTHQLLEDLGVLDGSLRVVPAPVASDADLRRVHTAEYLDVVRRAEADGHAPPGYGLGDDDTPVFGQVHTASARIAGSTLTAAQAVWRGDARRAASIAGGMHHAMPARASGFCVYNDAGVAISWLLEQGARVAYLDLDAHHGDGVERMFWDDERVLTISVHQHPGSLFPGTGYAQDVGSAVARGSAVNVALPPRTADAGWLRAVEAVTEPLVRAHAPDILVSQHGCDCHGTDPLAQLDVSIDAQRAAQLLVADVADRYAAGRWVALGGGGYEVIGVVPRAWAHLVAVVAGRPLEPGTAVPEAWRRRVRDLADVEAPRTMSDGRDARFARFADGFNPDDAVDRAIMATRQAVFPWHGLDPILD